MAARRHRRPDEREDDESAREEERPLDSGTVQALRAADPRERAQAILRLQRLHGNAAVQRDPSGVAAHHLDDHDAAVRFRRGVQAVDRIRSERHRGVEAEAAGCAPDVVVDGLRHTDDGNALQIELVRNRQRAVTADHHQGVESHLHEGVDDAIGVVLLAFRAVDRILERIAAIRRPEHRAAQAQDASDVLRRQRPRPPGIQQTIEAVFEANHLDAGVTRRLDDGTDDGVQSWCVSSAGEDANLLH